MKKTILSKQQLEQVIELRQSGDTWSQIQRKTGVPRRIASREYKEWQRSQSLKELKEARKEVVAQEFHRHLELLIEFATSLLSLFNIPDPINDFRSAEDMFNELLKRDIFQKQESFSMLQYRNDTKDHRVARMNKLLFQALQ